MYFVNVETHKLSRHIVLFLISLFGTFGLDHLSAQSSATGFPPLTAFDHGGLDQINLGTLNINIPLILYSREGRGPKRPVKYVYDNPVWNVVFCQSSPDGRCPYLTGGGLRPMAPNGLQPQATYVACGDDSNPASYPFYFAISFEDLNGTVHFFPVGIDDNRSYVCNGYPSTSPRTITVMPEDPDGWTLTVVTAPDTLYGLGSMTVTDPDGNVYGGDNHDRNGNIPVDPTSVSEVYYPDASCVQTASCHITTTFTYPTATGTAHFDSASSHHQLQWPCISGSATFPHILVDSITLANGKAYTFNYDVYGRVNSVNLPTGGTHTYTYPGSNAGFNCTDPSSVPSTSLPLNLYQVANVTRTVDGTSQWTYQTTTSTTTDVCKGFLKTIVVDPTGASVLHCVDQSGIEFISEGKGLSTRTCYAYVSSAYSPSFCTAQSSFSTSDGISPIATVIKSSQVTNLEDGSSWNTISYVSGEYGFTSNIKTYNYGNSNISAPDREWSATYDTSALPIFMTEEKLYDHGTLISDSQYSHDDYSVAASGSSSASLTTSVPARRGNVTQIKKWSGGSTWATQQIQKYYDDGLVSESWDGNSNHTVFAYDDCDHSFLTKIDKPLGISTHQTWECNTAQLASQTAENGYVTQYTYADPYFSRETQSYSPADGATTLFTYDDGARTVEINRLRDPASGTTTPGAGWLDEISVSDDLGRVSRSMRAVGSGQWRTVDTTYDAAGNISFVTNPYYSSGLSSPKRTSGNGVSYGFDSYGRPYTQSFIHDGVTDTSFHSYHGRDYSFTDESGKIKLYRLNFGGKVVQVCEVTGSGSDSPCGMGISGSGFTTYYTYNAADNLVVATQSGRIRLFSYDLLSHLKTSTNPETGTICYGIWSGGNCINGYDANGNLVAKTDARGAMITYGYDALNRLISTTYSGGGAAATRSSCYQYDTATNGTGRLGAEWTQAGACPSSPPNNPETRHTIVTYDAVGRIKEEQQCHRGKCSSGTPTTSTMHYDLAGNLTYYSNGIAPIELSQTYDTAGRLQSIGSSLYGLQYPSYPATLLSVGAYSPAGSIQNMNLGPVINVTRTYDNRLRITGQTVTHP
ncbi:RHS repeat protein [Edaphobacter modestus]|uniref:YD repeat-containing protein n=1 Tax=Edaphobacter modestus TaxID=388466 RepID=A0A4Q7XYZ5_9BACT|nr:RHS repeat protein [Edaphobacter modestus]RZU29011.1 YD repeat-containing protein [Edaphobacter modestus]